MNKILLILGSRGMLGQALIKIFEQRSMYAVIGWDRENLNLTEFLRLQAELIALKPNVVINAAAYNAVDRCEEDDNEYIRAQIFNTQLPLILATLSQKQDFLLVHYSTDYVFDGREKNGYAEDASPCPVSRYARTKWEGEEAVQQYAKQYYLIRLSKLFGKPGSSALAKKSFFHMMLEKAIVESELRVVDSEYSNFTYASDLARATHSLIEDRAPYGIYYLTNTGGATWYTAAQKLFQLSHKKVHVVPVRPSDFSRPAKRPAYSLLLNTKRPLLRPYEEALRDFLGAVVQ